MGLKNLLEFHNACGESLDKLYVYGKAFGAPNLLTVHPDRSVAEFADGRWYKVVVRGSLASTVLRDYLGTSPDPQLASHFEDFLAARMTPENGFQCTGDEVHEWLEEDCVIAHEPDGSAGWCTLYEQEGIIGKLIRRWRGL